MDWKDEYSVGLQEIDDQHRKFVKLFSSIEASAKSKRSTWQDILYGIGALKSIARSHFEFEEGLMRLYEFPETAVHKQSHEYFFMKLDEIAKQPHHATATNELIDFLIDWLMTHILGPDKAYAEHILSGASVVKSSVVNPAATCLELVG